MTQYTHSALKAQLESAFADNTGGNITAKTIRDNTIHIIDSIVPIMASGTDIYFKNDVDIRDASVTTATTAIGKVHGQWDDNNVAAICFLTGADTTNKDDGSIRFFTAPSGSSSSSGGPDLVQRMAIESNGQVNIYGSGVVSPALYLQSIHGSGLNLLLDGSTKDIAVPDGTSFQLGHWNPSTYAFTERLTVDSNAKFGYGVAHPAEPFHIRASGNAVRFDSKISTSNNQASIMLNKYGAATDPTAYGDDDLYAGFGMGVQTASSGHGYFFIGFDQSRNSKVSSSESNFVIDSGGKVGIGNRIPSERLVVGDDLGKISTDGTAFVVGSTNGYSRFIIGSGEANANLSNYSTIEWESDTNRLVLSTRSDLKKRSDQLILDSVTGNVGVGTSGVFPRVKGYALASLTFGDTEFDDVLDGTIAFTDAAGTSKTYTIKNDASAAGGTTEFNSGANRGAAAENLAQIIEGSDGHNGTIHAMDSAGIRFSTGGYDFSDGVVKFTQSTAGDEGNTTITTASSFDDCTDVNAPSAFTGGRDPVAYWNPSFKLHVLESGSTHFGVENAANSSSAVFIGKKTHGSGIQAGNWSSIGFNNTNDVLKINNSGSLAPSHLTLNSVGYVGINTDSPYDSASLGTDRLHVYGDNTGVIIGNPAGGKSALRLFGSRDSATSANDTAFVQAGTSAADTGAKLRISRFDTEATNISQFDVYSDLTKVHGVLALNDNWLSNDGGSEGVRIDNSGNVGIGVAAPSYQLELSTNSAAKPTSTLWTATSDERVKENIESIDSAVALDKIMSLRPVSFNFIDEYCHCHSIAEDSKHYNFIAQEVENVFPECVVEVNQDLRDDDGELVLENLKGLDAHAINIHMLSAIQELKIQLDAANARISQLEN